MNPIRTTRQGGRNVMNRRCTIAAGMILLALLAAPALADRVITHSGDAFTGTIIEEDATKVVLKTISGKITIPRNTIQKIERSGGAPTPKPEGTKPDPKAPPPKIVPVEVDPLKAAEALGAARSALVAGDWLKAGGLLEGLLALDERTFKYDDRLGATGALITCYLQIKDAHGAARAIARRAQLAKDPNDKRRLVASAEALRAIGSVEVGGKTLSRFEEVVEAAMIWKAEQCLAQANQTARKAKRLNERTQLDKAANLALKTLGEANIYQPGFSSKHEQEVLAALIENILEAGRAAVEHCKKVRPDLTQTRLTSIVSKAAAARWNVVGRVYLARRAVAERALKNLKSFTFKYKVPALYADNEAEVTHLLAELDEYQYYPKGTGYGYGYYGYGSSTRRLKIQLRTF